MAKPQLSKLPGIYAFVGRPLDYFYIVFFIFHTFCSLLIDGQYFYQPLIPQALLEVKLQYLHDSGDPLMSGIRSPENAWFKTAIILELLIQTPCFIIGSWGLHKSNAKVFPLLAVYGGLAASSTLFCLVQALSDKSLTASNRQFIAQAYGPFTAVPTLIMIDMLVRCVALIDIVGGTVQSQSKTKQH